MPRRRTLAAWGAGATLAALLACGQVPTLPLGIAYITPVLTPSPTVAWGDTLRDSLGQAAPLRVYAIGKSAGDTIRTIALRFLLTSLHSGATIDASGFLIAPDSLETLRVVAQVTDGSGGDALQLQTPELALEVVPRADSIAATIRTDTLFRTPIVLPLAVAVSGTGPTGLRAPVAGIRVQYHIVRSYPALPAIGRRFYMVDDQTGVLRPDSTFAIDTTAAGVGSRRIVGIAAPAGEAPTDSVVVEVRAWSQRHVEVTGSPVLFTLRFRSST